MAGPAAAPRRTDVLPLLKRVARAFYLTIRILPRELRHPVSLAYLLARTADTMADTKALPPESRLQQLLLFRQQLAGSKDVAGFRAVIDPLPTGGLSSAEGDLLNSLPVLLNALSSLDDPDRALVTRTVLRLTEGMEFDLKVFPTESSGEVRALATATELDTYTYLVAGCVGEFWTDITVTHTEAMRNWDRGEMTRIGVRFGKALQLTNVLRDTASDLRIGRCYLPSEWLDDLGLGPDDLLDPANSVAARPALMRGVAVALDHFEAAEDYLLRVPRRCIRLRLAVTWPLIMGLATLDLLAHNRTWLDPDGRSSVSRRWVYGMIAKSLLIVGSNLALRMWSRRLRRRVRSAT